MIDIAKTKELLQKLDFEALFIDELGWEEPNNKPITSIPNVKQGTTRQTIAELSGAVVIIINTPDGIIPEVAQRAAISDEISKHHHEHILIFVDKIQGNRSQCIWRWIKKQDAKKLPREHYYSAGQTGEAFIAKIASLFMDINDYEKGVTISDAAQKIKDALDIEKVTKKFFKEYQNEFVEFVEHIEGISKETDRHWYASVLLNRLMFIYFLQKKHFLDKGDNKYLNNKLTPYKLAPDEYTFFQDFLKVLFFEGFAKQEHERSSETNLLLGKIKYLNGGLFLKHKIEQNYPQIRVKNKGFVALFDLFDRYNWTLNDTPNNQNDNEINPDVLGYIFEKYINQKAFGAYYTRTEITEYLCEQTVYKLILDEINDPKELTPELLKQANIPATRQYDSIENLLLHLDAHTCKRLLVGEKAILTNMSLLDPACGSGAFLVAAMKVLINVYSAIIGKIEIYFQQDAALQKWLKDIRKNHKSTAYYIKKQIITHNLYGVDIMEEATEIAKLRLFLALVASAETIDQLEPLPNIDFNIMSGNSLIGLMRVDDTQFNKIYDTISKKKPKGTTVKKGNLFSPDTIVQLDAFASGHTKSYKELINEREAAIKAYKNAENLGLDSLQDKRDSIQRKEAEANAVLNELLYREFDKLKINYEKQTWDEKTKTVKTEKKAVEAQDIADIRPFHWGYMFSEIFRKKDGFDAIITNPPWETFKPQAKEFFAEYSELVTKNKMDIKDFEKEQSILLKNLDILKDWLKYQNRFPPISLYYRNAPQYKNQISIVNGKKAGTDINLYKLFTEQSYNLLRKNGYCGIVIPSGIYTDLGAKQLRELLFEQTKVTGLFCFENRKTIFENVDSRFKFVVLSFEKGGSTTSFPAAFMRHDVEELKVFPKLGSFILDIDFIRKQSPDALSIMEIKNPTDFSIAQKMLRHPRLEEFSFSVEQPTVVGHVKFCREFDMTNDSWLFNTPLQIRAKPDEKFLILYEGKMMHQFSHKFAEGRYWVSETEARKAILGRKTEENQTLDYQNYRLAYRAIASSTNERTLIAAILPKNCFCGNSLAVSKDNISSEILLLVGAFFNSFCLDYCLRQTVTANINMFYINQLPVPCLSPSHAYYRPIIERAAQLVCTTAEFADLWKETMHSDWDISKAATDDQTRNTLRAELDAIIAQIYGLTETELSHILDTFPIVAQAQKTAALAQFQQLETTRLASAQSNHATDCIATGENSTIEFKASLEIPVLSKQDKQNLSKHKEQYDKLFAAGAASDEQLKSLLQKIQPQPNPAIAKILHHSVLKTLAAFANSDGGTLLIGVDENIDDTPIVIGLAAELAHFKGIDNFLKKFDTLLEHHLGNALHALLTTYVETVEDKQIFVVRVKPSPKPVFLKWKTDQKEESLFYIRRAASTKDLTAQELLDYINAHWQNK
jgi:hypothetical protein